MSHRVTKKRLKPYILPSLHFHTVFVVYGIENTKKQPKSVIRKNVLLELPHTDGIGITKSAFAEAQSKGENYEK